MMSNVRASSAVSAGIELLCNRISPPRAVHSPGASVPEETQWEKSAPTVRHNAGWQTREEQPGASPAARRSLDELSGVLAEVEAAGPRGTAGQHLDLVTGTRLRLTNALANQMDAPCRHCQPACPG